MRRSPKLGGLILAAAVMEALLDGGGRHIELTLHEVGVSFNGPWLVAEQMGVRAERRREVVDQAAAAIILQTFLDTRRPEEE